jgi:hypothetical protein
MVTKYAQDVSEQTDRVIKNSSKYVLAEEIVAWSKLDLAHACSWVIRRVGLSEQSFTQCNTSYLGVNSVRTDQRSATQGPWQH